jgi:hypothetical protein
MTFFRLRPARAGDAKMDADKRLVFAWVYASGDSLFKDGLYFFVPESTAKQLRQSDLGGYELAEVPTVRHASYRQPADKPEPDAVLRLVVNGQAGVDDFGLQNPVTLIVSERALALLRAAGLRECDVYDYDPSYRTPTPEELRNQKLRHS